MRRLSKRTVERRRMNLERAYESAARAGKRVIKAQEREKAAEIRVEKAYQKYLETKNRPTY